MSIIVLLSVFSSCKKVDTDPIIVFRDSDSNIITGDTINTPINSTIQTFVEVDYPDSLPEYWKQIDGGKNESLIKGHDYRLKSNGCKTNGNNFEKIIITTQFADTLVHIGSIVKISALVGTDAYGEVVYKVVE